MSAWRRLPPERRLTAVAAIGLFLSLFLPWYQETVVAAGRTTSASLTGWAAFSFVEAALLLVAAGVLTLLWHRVKGRAFHLPGGDGWVISAAGAWSCLLVVWRILDKQGAHVSGPGAAVSGVEWGIFVALAIAGLLAYSGSRIRAAGRPEPALPDDDFTFARPARSRREGRERRGDRRGPARTTRPADAPAPPRRRRPPTAPLMFPTPDALAEPPTLRLGGHRGAEPPTVRLDDRRAEDRGGADAGVDGPLARGDEQLTIPFEDGER